MSSQPSTGEHQIYDGGSPMEKKAQDIIREMKEIKESKKLTYMDIMDKMAQNDESTMASLSTLRRVFHDGSEARASSFNYEEILTPIYTAVKQLEGIEKSDDPHSKELDGYRAVIRVQNEELDRLLELKEHLEERVEFLIKQIEKKDKLIDILMDKLT